MSGRHADGRAPLNTIPISATTQLQDQQGSWGCIISNSAALASPRIARPPAEKEGQQRRPSTGPANTRSECQPTISKSCDASLVYKASGNLTVPFLLGLDETCICRFDINVLHFPPKHKLAHTNTNMFISVASAVALSAGVALGCEIPAEAPSKNIPGGFSIQIQSPDFPAADGHFMNTWLWGGEFLSLIQSLSGHTKKPG